MKDIKNILVLVLIAFAVSIQIWLVTIFALKNFPPVNTLSQTVYPEWQFAVQPERDALLFHLFVFMSLALAALMFWKLRRRMTDVLWMRQARLLLAFEILWAFFLLSAAFKTIVDAERPQLATHLFWVIAALSVLAKIFFTELSQLLQRFYVQVHDAPNRLTRLVDIIFPMMLILILYIPDLQGVLARDFLGEQFHHWDSALMAPGWAFLSGGVLNVDVISQYGLGLPIFVALLAKILGGFSYEHVLRVMMGINICYYLGWFFLLRSWLKNTAVVIAGMLLAIKLQMFHTIVYPIVFTYPTETILRYAFDVLVFALMWGHLKSGKYVYVWTASMICGIAVFYMTTTGLCLVLTWCFYLGCLAIFPGLRLRFLPKKKDWLALLACLPIVVASVGVCLWSTQGQHMFTAEFWRNTQEFNHYFLSYFGTIPIEQNITDHNYLPLVMGLLIPAVYLGTLLMILSLYYWHKCPTEDLLAAFLAFYGLMLYHYFMARSLSTSSYDQCLPYVFIVCFWLTKILKRLNAVPRRNMALAAIAVSAYALVTNYNYVAYPNIFNLSRHPLTDPMVLSPLPDGRSYFNHLYSQLPMDSRLPLNSLGQTDEKLRNEDNLASDDDLRKYYEQEFDFSLDAHLIDDLVPAGGKVALVSSFETKILMDADRPPFFYYTPLIISRPMHMRTMVVTALYTRHHVERIIAEIEEKKPQYIFIERIFRRENMKLVNYQDGSAFLFLMRYIEAHYEDSREGHFLMALKRKAAA